MKKYKIAISALIATLLIPSQATSGSAQEWPEPLVQLVSVSTTTSSYYTTGQLSFDLSFVRLNNSTYSDTTRVWICPKANWDGLLCNSGMVLVSANPDSSQTELVLTSTNLNLAAGDYLVTAVSFRNGAVISGYTLMYPRAGVVTIGGIATNIAMVDLSTADFNLTPPAPAPEPEPVVEPEPEPTTEPESEPEPTPESEPETSAENGSTDSSSTEPEQTNNQSEPNSETEQTSSTIDSTQSEPVTEAVVESTVDPVNQPVTEPELETNSTDAVTEPADQSSESSAQTVNEPVTEPVEATEPAAVTEPVVTEPVTQPVVVIEPVAVVTEPVVTEPVTAVVVESVEPQSDESNSPVVVTQSNIEATTVTPTVQLVISPEVINQLDTSLAGLTTQLPITPLMSAKRITRKSAIGGEVLQLTGAGKVTRKISAGVGQLRLLRSQTSTLVRFKLGSKVIAQLDLAGRGSKTISWNSNKAQKLSIKLLGGPDGQILIDALQIGSKLIPNPKFRSYS